MPESNTGPTRVHSGVNDRAQRDYEDVDGPSATNRNHTYVPLPTNLRSNNYSRTTNPHDANGYAVPFQTLAKV